MLGNEVAVVRAAVRQDVLDKVVAELVASDVDERHARTVGTSLADAVQVPVEELVPANLQALLNDLGGILVHTVLRGEAQDVVDGTSAVSRGAVLADVLDAPVAELAMGDNIDAGKDLVDAGALTSVRSKLTQKESVHTLSSSRQFSKMFWTTRLPVSPRATSCHMPRRASLT